MKEFTSVRGGSSTGFRGGGGGGGGPLLFEGPHRVHNDIHVLWF